MQNFVSDVGGLAGLFLGFSLISLFELIFKCFMTLKNLISPCSCTKLNQVSEQKSLSKSRKRKNRKSKRKVGQSMNNTPDVVVIDMVFGEQIDAAN